MARIPVGNFGFKVAEPARGGGMPAAAFDTGLGEGLSQIGDTMASTAIAMRREDLDRDKELKQQIEAQTRARAALAWQTLENETRNATDSMKADIGANRLTRDGINDATEKAFNAAYLGQVGNIPEAEKSIFRDRSYLLLSNMRASLNEASNLQIKRNVLADTYQMGQQLERVAVEDPKRAIGNYSMVLDRTLPPVGVSPEEIAKDKQGFSERAWMNHYTAKLNTVEAADDLQGARALMGEVNASDGLDPTKKNAIIGNLSHLIGRIEARQQHAADKRLAMAEKAIDKLTKITLEGYTPSPDEISNAAELAKGTPMESDFKAWQQTDKYIQQFAYAPPRAMQDELSRLESEIRKRGATDELLSMRAKMETLYKHTREAIQTDPISFARERRLSDVAPLNLGNTDEIAMQMGKRLATAYTLRRQYGAPLKVFTSEEAGLVAKIIDEGGIGTRKQYLSAIAAGLQDDAAIPAVMAQVTKSPVMANAGLYLARNYMTTNNRMVGDLILKGTELIEKKQITMPKAADRRSMEQVFDEETEGVFVGKESARNSFFETAWAIYAARSAEEGEVSSGDYTGKRWKAAINMATGGVVEYNGANVIPPYGMDEDTFEKKAGAAVEKVITSKNWSGGISPDGIRRMELETIGNRRYYLRQGNKFLLDRKGNPITIYVTP